MKISDCQAQFHTYHSDSKNAHYYPHEPDQRDQSPRAFKRLHLAPLTDPSLKLLSTTSVCKAITPSLLTLELLSHLHQIAVLKADKPMGIPTGGPSKNQTQGGTVSLEKKYKHDENWK